MENERKNWRWKGRIRKKKENSKMEMKFNDKEELKKNDKKARKGNKIKR